MPPEADTSPPPMRRGRYLLASALLIALVLWAVSQISRAEAQIIPWGSLAMPVLCNVAFLVLAAWRMQILSLRSLPFRSAVNSIALVAVLLIAFPSRLSDLIKPVYLNMRAGLPVAQGFSVLFFERALDVLMVLGILGIVAFGLGTAQAGAQLQTVAIITVALAAGVAIAAFAPGVLHRLIGWLPFERLRSVTTQVLSAIQTTSTGGRLGAGAVLSVLVWLSAYLIFYSYLAALDPSQEAGQITAMAALVVFAAGTIGLIATVTPGGVGTYEFAIALALSGYGIPIAEGLVHGLVLRGIVLLPNLVIVVQMLIFDRFSLRGLRAQMRHIRETRRP